MTNSGHEDLPWAALGLSDLELRAHAHSTPVVHAGDALSAVRSPGSAVGFHAAVADAMAESVDAYATALPCVEATRSAAKRYLNVFDDTIADLDHLGTRLADCEAEVLKLQNQTSSCENEQARGKLVEAHVSAFVDEIILDPSMVRHIVDGIVGEPEYVEWLAVLRKKVAVFDVEDTKRAKCFIELKPVLNRLVATAATKIRNFLLAKIALLQKPGTNIQIIKDNVLVKHCGLVSFLDELADEDFMFVKSAYINTMVPLYVALFTQYATSLMALKVASVSDDPGHLVASVPQQPYLGAMGARRFPSILGGKTGGMTVVTGAHPATNASSTIPRSPVYSHREPFSPVEPMSPRTGHAVAATKAAAATRTLGSMSLGNRIDVLAKIDSPAVVLAVAESKNLMFFYEEIHRSLGRMLSETCSSEVAFCEHFFGDSFASRLGEGVAARTKSVSTVFFKPVVALLLEKVNAHATFSHDMIGILLALKVNEAQRTSMQYRNIFDLSDYFIRVDIALKPRFKRLFDANVASLSQAQQNPRAHFSNENDTKPLSLTRRFTELSSAVLTIAAYGATDDAILEGLRRMRVEFTTCLTAISALYSNQKSRYIFLVNNVDLVLLLYQNRKVDTSTDALYFKELHVNYVAAYVEQEVADHFSDLVAFVREHDRYTVASSEDVSGAQKMPPSETHVKAVLREFASNWHLGIEHMREGVMRSFPNFQAGTDILRALFARMFSYHRKCEAAVLRTYPSLTNELVAGTEIAYEVRQFSRTT